jgi:O-succinylbenzoic acid--CoA ligase
MGSMVTLDGHILPNREVRIADDGEIWVRGSCLFDGYLNQSRSRDWFPTGDLGRIENHLLHIVGRKDWMFISGGENIQPEEIERELLTLPQVLEAVVLPIDDAEFGKRPIAVVRANETFTIEQMQLVLSDRLPKFKIPIKLYLMAEIPQKNDFKPDRFILSQIINNQLNKKTSGQKKGAAL